MKKRIYYFLLLFIALLSVCPVTAANKDREEHDSNMRKVLFGRDDKYYNNTIIESDKKTKVEALQYASYLCIDYWNGSENNLNTKSAGETALDALKKLGVEDLPKNITDKKEANGINYTASGKDHRKYTHLGWDHNYSAGGLDNDKSNWPRRKKILQNTVKKVFNNCQSIGTIDKMLSIFGIDKSEGALDPRCNSLAAVIYYTHILVDYNQTDSYDEEYSVIPLVETAGKGDSDIIDEMEKHFQILFASQIESSEYKILKREINNYRKKAKRYLDVTKTPGGLMDSDNYDKYRSECVLGYLNMLQRRVPSLLQKEEFFKEVFNTGDVSNNKGDQKEQ